MKTKIKPNLKPKLKPKIVVSFSCLILSSTIAKVIAQEKTIDDPMLEEVLVQGYAASIKRAIEIKRNATSIVDAIESEDLGKFPDSNVAESLQRVPGVAIDRSGGEGAKVSVRGLGPEYNIVTMNGRVLPNPDGARSFSFDVLASEIISGAELYKSSQADLADGGIGAVVNVTTAKPLDFDAGLSGAGSVKGLYEELTGTTSPQFSGLLSYVNDAEDFGLVTSVAYQKRDARIDSAGPDAGWQQRGFDLDGDNENDLTAWGPRNMGFRVESSERERSSALVVAQWRPEESLTLTTDLLYSQFEIKSSQNQVAHWWGTNTNNAGPGSIKVDAQDTVVYWAGHEAPTEFVHSTANRPTTTYMLGFNLEKVFANEAILTADISTSKAKNDAGGTQSFAVTGYRNTAESSSLFQLSPGDDIPALTFPSFDPASGTYSAYYDPALGDYVGELTANPAQLTDTRLLSNHFMVVEGDDVSDSINELKVNFEKPVAYGSLVSIKTGAFYTDREFQRTRIRSDNAVINATSTGFSDPVPSHIGRLVSVGNFLSGANGDFPRAWLATDNQALREYYESGEFIKNGELYSDLRAADPSLPILDYTPIVDPANSPGVAEQLTGIYIKFDFEGDLVGKPWSGNIGARWVQTEQRSTGFGQVVLSIEPNPDDPTVTNVEYSEPQSISVENDYSNLLPSLAFKIDLLDDVDLRFGASQTITRPELGRLGVSEGINARPGDNRVNRGNPNLKPYKATNLDVALNYYFSDSGYVGVALMDKTIEDFIVQGRTQTQIVGIDFTAEQPINIEESGISGLELAAQYLFDQRLPGAWGGLGVQVNYTFVDSDSDYRSSEFVLSQNDDAGVFGIEGLSDTANFILSYEYGPLQARASYNWRDKFLRTVSDGQGEPVYTGEYGQWDISASYALNDSLSLFLEGINVTEQANNSFVRYESRVQQYIYTGSRFALGLRAEF